MKVQEVMSKHAKFCHPDTSLAEAAAIMWEGDCGTLPVVIDGGRVVGMITDRDIAMSLGMRGLPASHVLVNETMSKALYACSPEDDIHTALKTMRRARVRRLPVIDEEGKLQGILSMNDVALHAQHLDGRKDAGLAYEDVVNTFKAICEHLPQKVTEQPLHTHAAQA